MTHKRIFQIDPATPPLISDEDLATNHTRFMAQLQAGLPEDHLVSDYDWEIIPHPLRPIGHYIATARKRERK